MAGIVVAAALLGGCGDDKAKGVSPQGKRRVPVSVAQVQKETLEETVRGIGTLRAIEVVELRPEIAGTVVEILFEEGQEVKAEALLFTLDASKLQQEQAARRAELEAAQIRLSNAKRRFERFDSLSAGAVSRDERDDVETFFQTAKADVDRLEAELARVAERLKDTRINAPFTGMISEHKVDVGDFVEVGDLMATLYRADELEVAFTVPERFMGRVKRGQPVEILVDAYPDHRFRADVTFVSPSVDERTRDFLVKAIVGNPERVLKPGAFATAVVTVATRENRPVIPESALVATRSGYIVFVVRDGTAYRRDVGIGLRKPGVAEIREGLAAGETVVTAGQMNLSDGVGVTVRAKDGGESTKETEEGEGEAPRES